MAGSSDGAADASGASACNEAGDTTGTGGHDPAPGCDRVGTWMNYEVSVSFRSAGASFRAGPAPKYTKIVIRGSSSSQRAYANRRLQTATEIPDISFGPDLVQGTCDPTPTFSLPPFRMATVPSRPAPAPSSHGRLVRLGRLSWDMDGDGDTDISTLPARRPRGQSSDWPHRRPEQLASGRRARPTRSLRARFNTMRSLRESRHGRSRRRDY